jgi:hypothetical protein
MGKGRVVDMGRMVVGAAQKCEESTAARSRLRSEALFLQSHYFFRGIKKDGRTRSQHILGGKKLFACWGEGGRRGCCSPTSADDDNTTMIITLLFLPLGNISNTRVLVIKTRE